MSHALIRLTRQQKQFNFIIQKVNAPQGMVYAHNTLSQREFLKSKWRKTLRHIDNPSLTGRPDAAHADQG